MGTRDRIKVITSGCTLLWFCLIVAPALVVADELQQIEHPTIDFLFASNDVADNYREVYLEPISVWYPTGDNQRAVMADDLRRQASSHFDDALSGHGLERIDQPRKNSLIVSIQYIDLTAALPSMDVLEWTQQFRFRVEPGHLTLVAETRDAATGQVLMRIADLQEHDDTVGTVADQIDVALRQWSEVIASGVSREILPPQLAARN